MVRFFKKKEEQTQLTKSEIDELVKNAYSLGFEVGYHKHSELGWVSEQYSMLEDLAKESGLGKLVSENYGKGKEEGIKTKERDVNAGLSRKDAEKQKSRSDSSHEQIGEQIKNPKIEAGYQSQREIDDNTIVAIQQPGVTDLPSSTSRPKAIDRPSQIKGFKQLIPKR
ncbi:hypothetical protein HWN40_05895 [Methanolobus zinderi]|jgi:hypothetical protein|uniref:Uncharacterized protein n=1 Tax=Methanolobus zinderi TaxID=536044 RepID=A0A7D5J8N1_9EURY|nr:hypothetical protein [Methanolobus zinderi]KXS40750.1 MAG: hypothetical protein AWU59_2404 [Methanolobus sp. T82-4]QLC49810.1 hypothetical protein HWN40_05895 [Methanolobus zinderi]